MNKRSVFLSSSARDTAAAAKLAVAMEKIGLETFNPFTAVLAGADWRKSIHAAMRRTDLLLLVMSSPDDVASSWMLYEAGLADGLGKKIVTLVPERFSTSQLPPDLLGQLILQWDPDSPDLAAKQVASAMTMEHSVAHTPNPTRRAG